MKPTVPGLSPGTACDADVSITGIEVLPSELLLGILGNLSQHHLRVISRLSRRFRVLAYDTGLHIHKDVFWNSYSGFEGSLATVEQLINYATGENPGLNIALTVRFDVDTQGWDTHFYRAMSMFLVVLRRALPFLMGLDICVPLPSDCNLYAPLCADSAPRLRELVLVHCLEVDSPIPQNLFNGDAPRLRRVWLFLSGTQSSTIALQPVSVFQHVTELGLTIRHTDQQISIANMFPQARRLAIFVDEPALGRVDASGLDLCALTLNGGTQSFVSNAAVTSIHVIEHETNTVDTFWPESRSDLCARVESAGTEATTISFVPGSGTWRRSFFLNSCDVASPLPLADVHFLPTQLVSLTLDKARLNAFVRVPLSLDALREVVLDLGYMPSVFDDDTGFDEPEANVRCPALDRLVVLARGRGVTVRPTKLTRLARLIGVERPTLTLAGCTFSPAPVKDTLNELFSVIDIVPTFDTHVPDYYETCRFEGPPVWDIVPVV